MKNSSTIITIISEYYLNIRLPRSTYMNEDKSVSMKLDEHSKIYKEIAVDEDNVLEPLITDLKIYKICGKTEKKERHGFHSGNLYDHSVWVEEVIAEWCDSSTNETAGTLWCKNVCKTFNRREKYLLACAGFLHDIGKATSKGNLFEKKSTDGKRTVSRWYHEKLSHPEDGFDYLTGKQKYVLTNANGRSYDFEPFFTQHDIDSEERKLLAVLVATHQSFGTVLKDTYHHPHLLMDNIKLFFDKIQHFVDIVLYNNGVINDCLVLMIIVLGAADVRGSQEPTEPLKTILFNKAVFVRGVFKPTDIFGTLRYKSMGLKVYDQIMHYFKAMQSMEKRKS